MTRANFSDAYLSLILCTPGSLQSKSVFLFRPAAETLKFGFVALPRSLF